MKTSSRWPAVAAIAVIIGISVSGVLSMPLTEPDEARYAETARIMFRSGDWVVPYLGADVFLDKPPLLYWLSAVSFQVFGLGDGSARLPSFVAALACMAVVFTFARKLFGTDTALLSVAILASCPLFFGLGQLLTMDMLLTLWTTAGTAAVWLASRSGGKSWIRAAYAISALGVLTKGPIAVVLIWLPGFLYFAVRRDVAFLARWWDWRGAALFVLICAPWFLLVDAREPGFLSTFFWHHHVERFVNPWHHREPFWFFAPVALAGLLPWSVLWVVDPRRARSALSDLRRQSAGSYLLWCAAVPFVIFSMSSSKLIPYVLPALPPLAIALGSIYRQLLDSPVPPVLRQGGALLAIGGAGALVVGLLFYAWVPHWRIPILRPLLVLGGGGVLAAGLTSRRLAARGFGAASQASVLAGVASLLFTIQMGRGYLGKEYRGLTAATHHQVLAETTIVSANGYLPAVDFYLDRQIEIIERTDRDRLRQLWEGAEPVAIFVATRELEAMQSLLTGGTVIAREHHAAVIYNRDPPLGDTAGG